MGRKVVECWRSLYKAAGVLALYPSPSQEQHQTLCLLLGLYVALTLPFTYRCANLYRRDLMKGKEVGARKSEVSLWQLKASMWSLLLMDKGRQ